MKKLTWEQAVQWLRDQPDQQEFVQQCYYDDPPLDSAKRFVKSEEWAAIQDLIGHIPKGKMLEIGAGRGTLSYAFAQSGWAVTALEPDPSPLVGHVAIAQLKEEAQLNQLKIVSNWGESLPFPDAQFDFVFCRCVLHHAYDLPQMLKEIGRVLKPGGYFLAEREHVINSPQDLQNFLAAHPLHHLYGGENAFYLHQYKSAIHAAGLKIIRSIGPFDHPINYLPGMSTERLQAMTIQALNKLTPRRLAEYLGKKDILKQLYAYSLSWRSKQPGRFYSFWTRKPIK